MKILHTADWHLGKRLGNFSRHSEQVEVLEEICSIAEKEEVDIVMIAGDLFDTFNPPVESLDLFYKTLKRLAKNGERMVVAIAGNHDSPERIDAPDPLARECGIFLVGRPNAQIPEIKLDSGLQIVRSGPGFVEVRLPRREYLLRLLLTPFANEARLKKHLGTEEKAVELNETLKAAWQQVADEFCCPKGVNVLVSHLYFQRRNGETLEEPEGEKPLNIGNADAVYTDCIPEQIQYVALGHLHRFHNIGSEAQPIVYSSSPLCYSFSEAGQQKFVAIVDVLPGEQAQIRRVALNAGRRLERKKFQDFQTMIDWLQNNPNTLLELSFVSHEYLKAAESKLIFEQHDGIIHLIPITEGHAENDPTSGNRSNPLLDETELFQNYFHAKNGQAPNQELMDLFREIVGSDVDQEIVHQETDESCFQ